MFDRIDPLIDSDGFKKVQNAKIIIIGIGGVGGIVLETLVRTGVQNITVIDFDSFEVSNLNRQILSDYKSIGLKKVSVAKEKMKNINPSLNIDSLDIFLDKNININSYIVNNRILRTAAYVCETFIFL